MLLFAADPERGGNPDDESADPPESDPHAVDDPASDAKHPRPAVGSEPETPPPAAPPPLPSGGSPDDLPSYPRAPGPRADRRSRSYQQRRTTPEEDEYGLPTYPRARAPERRRPLLDRLLVLVVALGAVILLAYALRQADRDPEPESALAQAVQATPQAQIAVETRSSARVRQFVRDEFGWSVGVPLFGNIAMQGVGIVALAPGIEVPAFFYGDDRGRTAVVYPLNYALLDQVPERVRLSRADYERLAEDPAPRTHRIGGRDVVLWRDRADIFIMVTDIPPSAILENVRVAR